MRSQRGLPGIQRRKKTTIRPRTAPIPKARRQPSQTGNRFGSSQNHGCGGTDRRAHPVRAVDHQIHATANARRDQFIDGGIDRRVFTANARASERPKESVAGEVPGENRSRSRREIYGDIDEEQSLSSQPVCAVAEKKCAACAGEIEGSARPDLGVRQTERRGMREDSA
jgi:hypothetical protein